MHGGDATKYAYINHSTISNYSGAGIYIDDYQIYRIENCVINNNGGDGIAIYNSGFNLTGANLISANTISGNGNGTNLDICAGIKVYHSYSDIHNNFEINNNHDGIMSLNNSLVSIKGNQNARYCSQTQQIRDNERNQVYATVNSFPYYFRWNSIVDEDNQYPLIYYSSLMVLQPLNIQNNYWGTNFNPSTDLYPSSAYNYQPVWQLLPGLKETDIAELEYNAAQTYIEQEQYVTAKSILKQIPITFPGSQFAQASLKRLFELESFVSNNYLELKSFYDSVYLNFSDPETRKSADFMSNCCNIKVENWYSAINWFENMIEKPKTIEDSIFSIIDLGYTYFLMGNGNLKSSFNGKYLQYKFERIMDFELNRDWLLTLLFKQQNISNRDNKSGGNVHNSHLTLMQNVPNPFSNSTIIRYKIEESANIKISLFNSLGKFVEIIEDSFRDQGEYEILYNSKKLHPGVYFYMIELNGLPCGTRKMMLMF